MKFNLNLGHIANLSKVGATVVHQVLSPYEIERLVKLSEGQTFLPQLPIGSVEQNFAKCGTFEPGSAWPRLAQMTAEELQTGFNDLGWERLHLYFNDLSLQQYKPSSIGISPHRDHKKFIGLIGLYILDDGEASFCLCDNHTGDNPIALEGKPGDLILLRGHWPKTPSLERPFHFVGKVSSRRLTLGLRMFRDDSPLF